MAETASGLAKIDVSPAGAREILRAESKTQLFGAGGVLTPGDLGSFDPVGAGYEVRNFGS